MHSLTVEGCVQDSSMVFLVFSGTSDTIISMREFEAVTDANRPKQSHMQGIVFHLHLFHCVILVVYTGIWQKMPDPCTCICRIYDWHRQLVTFRDSKGPTASSSSIPEHWCSCNHTQNHLNIPYPTTPILAYNLKYVWWFTNLPMSSVRHTSLSS